MFYVVSLKVEAHLWENPPKNEWKQTKEDLITGRKEMFYVVSLKVEAHLWEKQKPKEWMNEVFYLTIV